MRKKETIDLGKKVESRERHNSEKNNRFAIFSTVFAVIIAPLLEAILIAHLSSSALPQIILDDVETLEDLRLAEKVQEIALAAFSGNSWFLSLLLIIIVCAHVYSAIIAVRDNIKESHYFEYKDLERNYELLVSEYESARSTMETQIAINLALSFSTTGLEQVIVKMNAKGSKYVAEEIENGGHPEMFKLLIWPFVQFREKIFGYQSDSFYNFALYLYIHEEKELQVAYREHDSRLPVQNRTWKPGKGHVGMTFMQKELMICNDVKESSELSSVLNTDDEYYRSFASVPILWPEDDVETDKEPLGVLVLTSAHKDQFQTANIKAPLATLSKLIAIAANELRTNIYKEEEGG